MFAIEASREFLHFLTMLENCLISQISRHFYVKLITKNQWTIVYNYTLEFLP